MNNLYIISQSLEYYDRNFIKNSDFYNNINFIKIIKNKNTEQNNFNYLEFYDKNKELIKRTRYEILGVYNSTGKIWTWSWSIAILAKNIVNTAKKIFNYGFDLDIDNAYLKNELITSRFKISNQIQLDIHIALGAYLSKKELIFKYKTYNDDIMKKTIIPTEDNSFLLNIKKEYDEEPYNEYYCILLD